MFKNRDYNLYSKKKNFVLAAFIKPDQKRIPNVIQSMLTNLEKEFKKNGYELSIKYFGTNKKMKLKNGENLGMLNKEELANLYEDADFGICGSRTNVSLLYSTHLVKPYENLVHMFLMLINIPLQT